MYSQPLTGSSSRLLARGVHLFSEKSLNMGWIQGDCLKPPSRFGKAGGREELEEVGAAEPDRDVRMKDSSLCLSAHFSSLPKVCVKEE